VEVLNDVFCSAPWTSLFIDTNGDVKPCCASRYPLGNINKDPVDTILNGKTLLDVRQSLLDGVKSEHCQSCYENERLSGSSTRSYFNENAPVTDPRLNKFQLKQIDIRWSNHCNLRCLYCGPHSSSSIAEFRGIKQKLSNKQWQSLILDFIQDNTLTLEHVFLVGGEPLLMKENIDLLDIITDQHIEVITNLSVASENNLIFKKLLEKPDVHFNISLEQVEEKFEHVRDGASWNTVLNNIETLKKHNKTFSFHVLYCLYSALDFHSVLKTLTEMSDVVIDLLGGPEHLNVMNHCQKIKDLFLIELDKVLQDGDLCLKLDEIQINVIKNLHESLTKSPVMDVSKKFISKQERNPDPTGFQNLWPEIWQIMKEQS